MRRKTSIDVLKKRIRPTTNVKLRITNDPSEEKSAVRFSEINDPVDPDLKNPNNEIDINRH